jgi:DNA invertase Pin-like site-specific DNA recombinase
LTRERATVQGAELIEVIVDGGESAKSLNRPGLQRLLGVVNSGKVNAVIVAKLDRLTRSVGIKKMLAGVYSTVLGNAKRKSRTDSIGSRCTPNQ